jgi:hypothetical protein
MPQPTVTANIHQPFDVHVHFRSKRTLHLAVGLDIFPDRGNFFRSQFFDLLIRFHSCGPAYIQSRTASNPVDICQCNTNVFGSWDVDAGYSSHIVTPSGPSEILALALFMTGILADHPNNALSFHNLAMLADLLYRALYFHRISPNRIQCSLTNQRNAYWFSATVLCDRQTISSYLYRYVILPRVKSYGDSST